ncbi:RNA-binding protein [Candidatus Woesearchaeota archaeon]|nr:RNA-binding protein [Candidatus Woesearchaeota archaeon]
MNAKIVCGSCKTPVANMGGVARFPCPKCAKTEIIRCSHCRAIAAKYKCHECGFEGPN